LLVGGAQGRQVPGYKAQGWGMVVHQDYKGGASTEGLETHSAGSGKEIQHPGTTQVVAKDTKNGLSHSIGGGSQALTL
jgi:hypothetical protein